MVACVDTECSARAVEASSCRDSFVHVRAPQRRLGRPWKGAQCNASRLSAALSWVFQDESTSQRTVFRSAQSLGRSISTEALSGLLRRRDDIPVNASRVGTPGNNLAPSCCYDYGDKQRKVIEAGIEQVECLGLHKAHRKSYNFYTNPCSISFRVQSSELESMYMVR